MHAQTKKGGVVKTPPFSLSRTGLTGLSVDSYLPAISNLV
jgi:hypothetical protein